MRFILVVIILICAVDAFAAQASPRARTDEPSRDTRFVLAAGIAAVAEKANDNRNFEPRALIFGRAGLTHLVQHEFLVEVGMFKQETGSSGVEVSRLHQQVDLWYHFLFFPRESIGHPFVGAALGAQRDEVSTNFFGQTAKDTGAFEAQISVAGGYRFNLGANVVSWLEGRLTTSNNYEPRILPSVAASIGLHL